MLSSRLRELLAGLAVDLLLDVVDDSLGLLLAPVDEEPARALGDVAADTGSRQAENRADRRRQDASRGRSAKIDGVEQRRSTRARRSRRPSQ